jgi:hypothetical protein
MVHSKKKNRINIKILGTNADKTSLKYNLFEIYKKSEKIYFLFDSCGIVGSNPTGTMDVCLVQCLSLRGADPSSRGVLPTVVCA